MLAALLVAMVAPVLDRPNVLVIFTDDHAAHAISAYGSKINKTPGIDRLAQEGVRFDRFYTTNPICAPSRATLLTGKYSHKNGHRDNRTVFDGSQQTLPKLFGKAGYETAIIGKWHLESEPQGFDHWEILPGQGVYYNPDFITPSGTHRESGYVTDLITDKALQWISARKPDRPFFLMVQHKAPHRNWEPALRHLDMFKGQTIPEPEDLFRDYTGLASGAARARMQIGQHMILRTDLKIGYTPPRMSADEGAIWDSAYRPQDEAMRRANLQGRELTRAYYQRYIKDYLRCVAAVDESVAKILDYLKSNRLDGNTIVVYASDQGFFLGDFGWYDKRWFYEPSARTPLIIKWPHHGKAGAVAKGLASNVDIASTLLDMAGIDQPADLQGISLAPMVEEPAKAAPRQNVYAHFYESDDPDHQAPKYVALRTDRYKLVFYEELGEWELFDMRRDPHERKNIATDLRNRSLMRQLAHALVNEQRKVEEDPVVIERVEQAIASLK